MVVQSPNLMAIVGVSEFTFGFAFLYEQTSANWGEVRAAPILPSLQAEQDAGWDARLPLLGVDFYYQFKLSDYLSRGNAKHIKDGTYQAPYYRFYLHKKNNNQQHRRLRQHCINNPFTYYVAPEFNTLEAFNASFVAQDVRERSRIIPLTDCEDIADGEHHYITFGEGQQGFVQHSTAKHHEHSVFGKQLPDFYRSSARAWVPVNRGFAENLLNKARVSVAQLLEDEGAAPERAELPLLQFNTERASQREILLRTSEILSTFFGLTLVVIGERRQ